MAAKARTFNLGELIGIALVTTLLVINAVLTYRNTQQLHDNAERVSHAHQVIDLTNDVLLALTNAETGERGYLLTRREEYLQPYETALPRLTECLGLLKDKTKDESWWQKEEQLPTLEKMANERVILLKDRIERARKFVRDPEAAAASQKGKKQMDDIRALVATMSEHEHEALKERERDSSQSYQLAVTTGLLTAGLGLIAVGAFFVLLQRSLYQREKASRAVNEQREWLKVTLSSIGDAVIATDTESRVVLLNPIAESLTGWTQAEAEQQPLETVFKIVNEQTRQPVEDPTRRVLREGIIVGLANHTILVSKDGTERPIEDSAAPILYHQRHVSGVVLVFRDNTARRNTERERQQLLESEQAARSQAEAAKERLAFLAEASAVLASSLNYAQTLEAVARLAIPTLADWCSVELLAGEPEALQRVAVVHKDASKIELANELRRLYPPDPKVPTGTTQVMQTRKSEWVAEITDAMLEGAARDPEHLRILRGLGLRSIIIVPLIARETALGALLLASEKAGRQFTEEDVALAEDLARRCATAIDNSRLYRQAQERIQQHRRMEEQLTFLVQASGTLTRRLEPNAVLTSILQVAQQLLPADAHGVWRFFAPTGRWGLVSSAGLSENYQRSTIEILQRTPQMSETPFVAEDVFQMPSLADRRAGYEAEGIRSFLAVPLRANDEICGTLTIYHRQPHRFDDAEIRVASAIANLASSAIQSADLFGEQARLRAAADEQKEWFRITLSSIGDAVIAADPEGLITFLNPIAQDLTGWAQAEAFARPLADVFHIVNEKTRAPVENPAMRALKDGVVIGLANHTILIAKDGTERPIADSAAPIRDETGTIHGVILVFRDVTEQQRAEHELITTKEIAERRAAELDSAIESMPDAVYFGNEGGVTKCNANGLKMLGVKSLADLQADINELGEKFALRWPETGASLNPNELQIARALQGETVIDQVVARRADNGQDVYIRAASAPIRLNGRIIGAVSVNSDITDQKRSELMNRFLADISEALVGSLHYQSILRRMAEITVPFLADFCFFDVITTDNRLDRVGWKHVDPAKEGLSAKVRPFAPSLDSETHPVAIVIRTGRPVFVPEANETWFRIAAGSVEHLEYMQSLELTSIIIVPLIVGGQTLGALTFCYSDSKRRYSLDELRLAEEVARRTALMVENARLYSQLREADRLKDEFLAMLAHELRNPLAPIRNSLHIMKQPAINPEMISRVRDMAERQVQHMALLLDDLLDVSRISRGRIELRKETIDLPALVSRTLEAVRPLLEDRQHELTVSLPTRPLFVQGDATRLEQILTNLVNNSAKYTDPGGHIWVSVERSGGGIVLRVKDTGIGIAPEMLPRIFDLFVQVERRVDRSRGGIGIGLTLVRRLVELHGGKVEARSAGLGKGSEFIVRLPEAPVEAVAETAAAPSFDKPVGAAAPRRVLVVDDNTDAAESLALLLRLQGQEVQVAFDGSNALATAATFRPQIIFLDIGMPGMDGYEVARRLRREPNMEKVTLVALTGWGQEEDRRRSQDAGFDLHIVKPVEPEALQELFASF